MAEVKWNFSCGCGYQCKTPLEADLHVEATGHKMEVHGMVIPKIASKEGE